MCSKIRYDGYCSKQVNDAVVIAILGIGSVALDEKK